MSDIENSNELNARLSALPPAKRAWLENRILSLQKNRPLGKTQAEVVQLQAGNGELPVYFIHAGPYEIILAQAIGAGHSIFGIELKWPLSWRDSAFENNTAELPTMQQLVAPFTAALSNHVRSFPCVLAGYSFAGLMAFEAAHQLQRLGGKVEMVMLVDSRLELPLPSLWLRFRREWKNSLAKAQKGRSGNLLGIRLRNILYMIWWIFGAVIRRIFRLFHSGSEPVPSFTAASSFIDERHEDLPWGLVERIYGKAENSFEVSPLNSHGVVFRERSDADGLDADDEGYGWKGLFARGLEIIGVPGDHFTMISEDRYRLTLGRKMAEVLRSYKNT
jgi:thioesterase domain-containing protein